VAVRAGCAKGHAAVKQESTPAANSRVFIRCRRFGIVDCAAWRVSASILFLIDAGFWAPRMGAALLSIFGGLALPLAMGRRLRREGLHYIL
jgi:hypothetical protein